MSNSEPHTHTCWFAQAWTSVQKMPALFVEDILIAEAVTFWDVSLGSRKSDRAESSFRVKGQVKSPVGKPPFEMRHALPLYNYLGGPLGHVMLSLIGFKRIIFRNILQRVFNGHPR